MGIGGHPRTSLRVDPWADSNRRYAGRLSADGNELRIAGTPNAIADALLAYGELGFAEVRVDLQARSDVPRTDAIAWMQEVVSRVHAWIRVGEPLGSGEHSSRYGQVTSNEPATLDHSRPERAA